MMKDFFSVRMGFDEDAELRFQPTLDENADSVNNVQTLRTNATLHFCGLRAFGE